MKASAIGELPQLAHRDLFETVSDGIKHIIENAGESDRSARKLFEIGECHSGEIILGIAEEEASKVLILIDAVRCPSKRQKELSKTLKCFYDHLPKQIYSEMCGWNVTSFEELTRRIEAARKDTFLDGPNGVDWIFPNHRKTRREGNMYVDYVRDITVESGPRYWQVPIRLSQGTYVTPKSYQIACALYEIGATTPEGLDVVARLWREFEPMPETTRRDIVGMNAYMLMLLQDKGMLSDIQKGSAQLILHELPFPLWSIDLQPLDKKQFERMVGELREERTRYIERWKDGARKRESETYDHAQYHRRANRSI